MKQNSSILFQVQMANSSDRVAFSPGEFAALFGKSQTWGYRQIYAGKVKAITEHGRMLIPASAVNEILEKAGVYVGLSAKRANTKKEFTALAPRAKGAWEKFIERRRTSKVSEGKAISNTGQRQAALQRLARCRSLVPNPRRIEAKAKA